MNAGLNARLLSVWLALSAITALSWWIGSHHGHDAFQLNAAITFSVIAIAAIKVRFIMCEFMEVRQAPRLLRRLTDLWLLFTAVGLLGIYTVGTMLQAA
jgi:apolipoprotein N-acyltransferase